MAKKKKPRQSRWVIFVVPEEHGAGPNHFYAEDGSHTDSRRNAAKFDSHKAASDFVRKKGIALQIPLQYIAQADFSEFELGDEGAIQSPPASALARCLKSLPKVSVVVSNLVKAFR